MNQFSKFLRLSIEECGDYVAGADLARDAGASSDDVWELLTPEERGWIFQIYSPSIAVEEWTKAEKKTKEMQSAHLLYMVVCVLRGSEDAQRRKRGIPLRWEKDLGIPGFDDSSRG